MSAQEDRQSGIAVIVRTAIAICVILLSGCTGFGPKLHSVDASDFVIGDAYGFAGANIGDSVLMAKAECKRLGYAEAQIKWMGTNALVTCTGKVGP
jgi:hypothetical protein